MAFSHKKIDYSLGIDLPWGIDLLGRKAHALYANFKHDPTQQPATQQTDMQAKHEFKMLYKLCHSGK